MTTTPWRKTDTLGVISDEIKLDQSIKEAYFKSFKIMS